MSRPNRSAATLIWLSCCRTVLLGILAVALFAAVAPIPAAQAAVGLSPGLGITIGESGCSLGFLATNAEGERLAVTAGHCAQSAGQKVYSRGTVIGRVVHITPDDVDNEVFGVTVIQLSSNAYTLDAYFTRYGPPSNGDYVKKYGARTDKTEGKIISVDIDPNFPRMSRMASTLVGLPGDSGSAWVGNSDSGPKLLGINIGYTRSADGGYGDAIGFPINSLIALVKQNSPQWGQGFIPVGT